MPSHAFQGLALGGHVHAPRTCRDGLQWALDHCQGPPVTAPNSSNQAKKSAGLAGEICLASNVEASEVDWAQAFEEWGQAGPASQEERMTPARALIQAIEMDNAALAARAIALDACEEMGMESAQDEPLEKDGQPKFEGAERLAKLRERGACDALLEAARQGATSCAALLIPWAMESPHAGRPFWISLEKPFGPQIALSMLAERPTVARSRRVDGSTALMLACARKQTSENIELFEALFAVSDKWAANGQGETALTICAQSGFLKGLRSLAFDEGFNAWDGAQALSEAARMGHAECVKFLLESGKADANMMHEGSLALEMALDSMGRPGWFDCSMELLRHSTPQGRHEKACDAFGMFLHELGSARHANPVFERECLDVTQSFIDRGWVGMDGRAGLSQIQKAASTRRLGIFELVIHAAAPSAASAMTPLMWAAQGAWPEGVQALLGKDDPNALDADGLRALDHALLGGKGFEGETARRLACVNMLLDATGEPDWSKAPRDLARRVATLEGSEDFFKLAARALEGFAQAKGSSGLAREALDSSSEIALSHWLNVDGFGGVADDGLSVLDAACRQSFAKHSHDQCMRLILGKAQRDGFVWFGGPCRSSPLIAFTQCEDRSSFKEFMPQLVEMFDVDMVDRRGLRARDALEAKVGADSLQDFDAWALAKVEREELAACANGCVKKSSSTQGARL
jgi:ankyrin repeat protein